MSLELHVLLPADKVPETHRWQDLINQAALQLVIDTTPDLRNHSGFWPCELKGQQSGFETYLDDSAELVENYPSLKKEAAGRDKAVSFRWGSDMSECACLMVAAAALVKGCGGVAYYPDDDLLYDAEGLLRDARGAMEAMK